MTTLDTNSTTSEATVQESAARVDAFGRTSLLAGLAAKDWDLVQELAQNFLRYEPQQRRKILQAILQRDRAQLAGAMHCLRGSLCIFGAESAYRIAEQLESAAATIDLWDAYGLFEKLEQELSTLTKSLKAIVPKY